MAGDEMASTGLERASEYHLTTLAEARNASPGTVKNYRVAEDRYCLFLRESLDREPTVADLTARNLVAFCEWLRNTHVSARWGSGGRRIGHSADNIRQHMRIIKAWSHFLAIQDDRDDPLRKIHTPKRDHKVVEPFSKQQTMLMVDLCDQTRERYRNRALLLFMLDTGVRVSELCTLQAKQIELWTPAALGRAKVLGKGRKERFVYVGAETSDAIRAYVQMERPDDSPHTALFLLGNGEPLTPAAVLKLVKALGRRAGIEGMRVSPHVFRHTAAIRKLRAGVGVQVLQAVLGHERIEQTMEYSKLVEGDVRSADVSVVDGDDQLKKRKRGLDKRTRGRRS